MKTQLRGERQRRRGSHPPASLSTGGISPAVVGAVGAWGSQVNGPISFDLDDLTESELEWAEGIDELRVLVLGKTAGT